jgi:hypothetical protein
LILHFILEDRTWDFLRGAEFGISFFTSSDLCAFAAPRGLTFGNSGRNLLNRPHRTNFNMGLLKQFPIKESKAIEFRWETYNTFNHTQFDRVRRSFGSSDFLTATTAHDARIMQFALKFLFYQNVGKRKGGVSINAALFFSPKLSSLFSWKE